MSIPGPRIIGYQVTTSMHDYLERLIDLGLVEGAIGAIDLKPEVRPLIEALHHVLAGGTVNVTVTQPGNSQVVNDLGTDLKTATSDTNTVNKALGFSLTAAP
jgi:hypothetical protein